jgi:hypothetical protein
MSRLADHMSSDEINDLIGPICELADLEISADKLFNDLITAARKIRDREGFLVTDGSELDF